MSLLKHLRSIGKPLPTLLNYKLSTALKSDVGCCRTVNEDCIYYSSPKDDSQTGLAIVADGMGGHAAGETASREAVRTIQSNFFSELYFKNPGKLLKKAILKANYKVYQLSCHDPSLSGMGTTVTCLLIVKGFAYFGHVGDSRLYLFRDGSLTQLTQDHTLVQQMLLDGLITQEQAANHPDRNIINRSIGTKPLEEVDVIKSAFAIQIDDIFMLCSDGLYDLVPDLEITKILAQHNPEEACRVLIELARSAGGYDNISVIVISVKPLPLTPKKPSITRY